MTQPAERVTGSNRSSPSLRDKSESAPSKEAQLSARIMRGQPVIRTGSSYRNRLPERRGTGTIAISVQCTVKFVGAMGIGCAPLADR